MTLDPDVEALLRAVMRKSGPSFKEALNQAIRAGLTSPAGVQREYRQKTFRMGFLPEASPDKTLAMAAALEDEDIARKLGLRK